MAITGLFVRVNDSNIQNSYVNIASFHHVATPSVNGDIIVNVNIYYSESAKNENLTPALKKQFALPFNRTQSVGIYPHIYTQLKLLDDFAGFSDT